MYSNLLCKQLLCHEKIIDYLLNTYVLWAWDVTYPSNGNKYDDIHFIHRIYIYMYFFDLD